MVDVFEHSARLDTAAVEERRNLVQIIPDGGKLPCDPNPKQNIFFLR